MIMMSVIDITTFAHASGRGYIRKSCTSLWAVVWVSGTKHFSQLLGGHWPSTLAVLVPFIE